MALNKQRELNNQDNYYELDGAYFRAREGELVGRVTDVLHGDKWVPYQGERCKPCVFGNQISESDFSE